MVALDVDAGGEDLSACGPQIIGAENTYRPFQCTLQYMLQMQHFAQPTFGGDHKSASPANFCRHTFTGDRPKRIWEMNDE